MRVQMQVWGACNKSFLKKRTASLATVDPRATRAVTPIWRSYGIERIAVHSALRRYYAFDVVEPQQLSAAWATSAVAASGSQWRALIRTEYLYKLPNLVLRDTIREVGDEGRRLERPITRVMATRHLRKSSDAKSGTRTSSIEHRAPLTISRPELLVGGSDASFRRLVHNIFAFASRHEAMRAGHGARIGLTGIEYTFLISIRHLEDEGEVSVKLLADHLHLSGPFATTMVGKLIKRNLVAKETDAQDKRRVSLSVTAEGHALLAELAPAQRQVNDVQFGCLTREEFQFLLAITDKLILSADQALALQSYLATSAAAA